jgi:hypothetical protein
VDPDWVARFFGSAQDVSNEDMQKLWARILAGEVVKPGTFSLRTLEVLKNLSQREAERFQEAASMVSNDGLLLLGPSCRQIFRERMLLADAGLLLETTAWSTGEGTLHYVGVRVRVKARPNQPFGDSIGGLATCHELSIAGKELLRVLKRRAPSSEYLEALRSDLTIFRYDSQLLIEPPEIDHQ